MDFSDEPPHSSKLLIRDENPWNAEPKLEELINHKYTPDDLMYCRNHCPIKRLDAVQFKLRVDGFHGEHTNFTLSALRQEFDKHEVVAALQCAGNRRKRMAERKHKDVEGLMWEEGTICNARWGGVLLRDLLGQLSLDPSRNQQGLHVCFASNVTACQDDGWFGASIPLEKVMDEEGDVLVAYEVNGHPLTPDHGYPFRIVVPGYSGVRWVKWVDHIKISDKESENYYQQKDYKVLPPEVETHEMADSESWWSKVPAIQANPLNSAIATAKVENNILQVKGYAVGGPNGQVANVDISVDGGESWIPTVITYQEGTWSWTLWEAELDLVGPSIGQKAKGPGKVWSRAIDDAGNAQELNVDWNLRGIAFSAVGEAEF